jgi:hypothetical protein
LLRVLNGVVIACPDNILTKKRPKTKALITGAMRIQ